MKLIQNKKLLMGSCFYAFSINGIIALILGAIMPMMRESYNLSYGVGGMLLSASAVGNLISSFIASILPIYIGRKASIITLCSMTFLGFSLIIFTGNPLLLTLAFFMTGLGRGGISNYNNTIVMEQSGGSAKALNILHSFFAIGAFIAPFLVLYFTRVNSSGWKYAIGFAAIMAIVMVILFSMQKITITQVKEKDKQASLSFDFLKNDNFWITTALLFFYLCAETAINGWIVSYFKGIGVMSDGFAQTLASLLWLVILFGRLFCSYISDKINRKYILLSTTLGASIFFILLISTRNLGVITTSIIGLGFCMAGIYPTAMSNLGLVIKKSPMAMGSLLTIGGIGAILMPMITGWVAEISGIAAGMSVVSVSVVLMVLFGIINLVRQKSK